MTHEDRVKIIEKGICYPSGVWADLGCGKGAFTLALAEQLDSPAQIYAVDEDRRALQELRQSFGQRHADLRIHFLEKDITRQLDLPPLDGILMANSLHYIEEKLSFIKRIRSYLRSTGCLLLVEYNVKRSNPWVPYPISFEEWEGLAEEVGFKETKLLGTQPSKYQHEFYAAVNRI